MKLPSSRSSPATAGSAALHGPVGQNENLSVHPSTEPGQLQGVAL